MADETLIRSAAVVAAAALVAAPYRDRIVGWLAQAAEAAGKHRASIGRAAAAALLIAAAWGKVPMPHLNLRPAVTVDVDTPASDMQAIVAPVAAALKDEPAAGRALWASAWQKAGVVVAGDAVTTEVVAPDTRSLRAYTTLALDIAWRRIGKHVPGSNEPLRKAVEDAFAATIGTKDAPVTADLRDRYVKLCNALAWAAVNGG